MGNSGISYPRFAEPVSDRSDGHCHARLFYSRSNKRPRHLPPQVPRDTIARIHFFHVKEEFLKVLRNQPELPERFCNLSIYPDLSAEEKGNTIQMGILKIILKLSARTRLGTPWSPATFLLLKRKAREDNDRKWYLHCGLRTLVKESSLPRTESSSSERFPFAIVIMAVSSFLSQVLVASGCFYCDIAPPFVRSLPPGIINIGIFVRYGYLFYSVYYVTTEHMEPTLGT